MADVYQRKESKYFMARWYVYSPAEGKWKRKAKSTRLEDRSEALERAKEWQANADKAAAQYGVSRKNADRPEGARISESEMLRLSRAMDRDPSRDPLKAAVPFREFGAEYLARVKNETTRADYALVLERFVDWCAENGHRCELLEDIKAPVVEGWRDALVKEGFSARRTNFQLSVLRGLFHRAQKFGYAQGNPASVIDKVKLNPTRDDLAAKAFSREQLSVLRMAPYKLAAKVAQGTNSRDLWEAGMATEWEVFIVLSAVVGCREGDAVRLDWKALDLERETLDYLPVKTSESSGKRILFPLKFWPELVGRLREHWEDAGCPTEGDLFPGMRKRAERAPSWLINNFVRILETAGIDREVLREAGKNCKRARYAYSIHSLRHTAVTDAMKRGIPPELRKELFGHSTVEMNKVYTHIDLETMEALLERNQGT